MSAALEFRAVDILFCAKAGRRASGAAIQQALAALDSGGTRAEIAARTGVVVGVANASLSVERGEISVLMGSSGSGKSTLLRAANGLNRSEEHTSELQSQSNLVCRLLLDKKNDH